MARMDPEERRRQATVASAVALEVLAETLLNDPLRQRFSVEDIQRTRATAVGAKGRCTNPKNVVYENYGGRGIEFRFPSIRSAVEWILYNLGPRPTPAHSLDRIDNNRHYEPGNLRWATRSEQARNKRQYKRTTMGERVRAILAQRSDITYETVRQWIHKGFTDDEILQRRKHVGCGIRHQKLRAEA